MARESNKTQAIVDYCKKNPGAKPKEISEALKKELGLDVKPQYISSIRTKFGITKRRRGRLRRTAAAASTKAGPRKKPASYEVLIENLKQAKRFLQSVGDLESARQALDAVANLR